MTTNKTYKLLTPGPLTTTLSVKSEMLFDHCTWDDDYKSITQEIRAKLLELAHVSPKRYTTVLMQGSGTFGNESVLTSVVPADGRVLVCNNGAYGVRLAQICRQAGVPCTDYAEPFDAPVDPAKVAEHLAADPSITHVAVVHSETISGLLNDIDEIDRIVKDAGKVYIVDAMSSFAGVDIPVEAWGIDFIVSSANKCIQGVPGFSFIICRRDLLEASAGCARSLSLDLYGQWKTMEDDGGKWRYTSPTHTVLAFAQALRELEEEGGIPARAARYAKNNRLLIERMTAIGFTPYLKSHQGPIITTFAHPADVHFTFQEMYAYIKERGYVIYPGKLTDGDTFRIGNIGEIYPADVLNVTAILSEFVEAKRDEQLSWPHPTISRPPGNRGRAQERNRHVQSRHLRLGGHDR